MATKRRRRKNAPKLNDQIREQIVVRFACRYTPEEVREWLKAEHGIELEPSALSYYNGNNRGARAAMPEKWREVFQRTQAEHFADVTSVPISHKAERLRIIQELVDQILPRVATPRGVNVVLVEQLKALAEYSAREMGEAFTNRKILEHDARGNLAKLLGVDPAELPDDADA